MSYKVWIADGASVTEVVLGTEQDAPQLVSVVAIDAYTVELEFDQPLLFHAFLGGVFNVNNYVIEPLDPDEAPQPSVVWVFRHTATTVRLFVTEMVQGVSYRATASNIESADGYAGSPTTFEDFTGIGIDRITPNHIDYFVATWPGLQINETELVPPYYLNEEPYSGQTDVPIETGLVIDILDDDSGVDPALTKFWIQGVLIYENQIAIPGWVVTKTPITNGYHYSITHVAPLPANVWVTWRVFAGDLAPLPNTMDAWWEFKTREWGPPYIINKDPGENEENVAKDTPITFSIVDEESLVTLSSIEVWVRGASVFKGTTGFALAWGASSYSPNASLGYDFELVPPAHLRWGRGELISVRVTCKNAGEKWMDDTWYFTARPRPFTFRIYHFLFDGVRTADEDDGED